jgi:hypothetical protein
MPDRMSVKELMNTIPHGSQTTSYITELDTERKNQAVKNIEEQLLESKTASLTINCKVVADYVTKFFESRKFSTYRSDETQYTAATRPGNPIKVTVAWPSEYQ